MQCYAIHCNTMQYHASLITADGAYHCPVDSIMAIFYCQRYLDESVSELVKYLCGIVSRYQSISVAAPRSVLLEKKGS